MDIKVDRTRFFWKEVIVFDQFFPNEAMESSSSARPALDVPQLPQQVRAAGRVPVLMVRGPLRFTPPHDHVFRSNRDRLSASGTPVQLLRDRKGQLNDVPVEISSDEALPPRRKPFRDHWTIVGHPAATAQRDIVTLKEPYLSP